MNSERWRLPVETDRDNQRHLSTHSMFICVCCARRTVFQCTCTSKGWTWEFIGYTAYEQRYRAKDRNICIVRQLDHKETSRKVGRWFADCLSNNGSHKKLCCQKLRWTVAPEFERSVLPTAGIITPLNCRCDVINHTWHDVDVDAASFDLHLL